MIVVFGGTGKVGRAIATLLHGEGYQVRVVSRSPDHARSYLPAGIEILGGNIMDASSLPDVLSDAKVVVCTVHGGEGKGANGPRGIEGQGFPELVRAAGLRKTRHFVYVSAASASPDSPAEFFRLKAAAESALRASGIPYSILRPTHLLDTWAPTLARSLAAKSRAMLIGSGSNPVSWVAGEDIAAAAARRAMTAADAISLDLAGPEDISVDLGGPEALTMRQLNQRFERALGVRAKRTTAMPPAALRLASGLLRPFSEILARQMQLGLLLDGRSQAIDSTAAWKQLGVTPTTIDEWLGRNLPGYLAGWGLAEGTDEHTLRSNTADVPQVPPQS